ncbi:MAG: 2-dehydropantoate 2-reductase [Alphaproteobacteria bacterium]
MKRLKDSTIGIIGAGAIGGFYAGQFHRVAPDSVRMLARGERLARLRGHGLDVNGRHYEFKTIDTDSAGEAVDLLIVAVKDRHLDDAIQEMGSALGPETIILSLMNGVDSEERIRAVYPSHHVLYGICVGISAVRAGHSITAQITGKLMFGEARNIPESEQVGFVRGLFSEAGIAHEVPEDMIKTIWWKFMVNVGINPLSAILRAPYGVFQRPGEARTLMLDGMREVVGIARAKGIPLDDANIDEWCRLLDGISSPTGKTSMYQDVEAGRETEIGMLSGKVQALGRESNIPTPINDMYLRLIRCLEPAGRDL